LICLTLIPVAGKRDYGTEISFTWRRSWSCFRGAVLTRVNTFFVTEFRNGAEREGGLMLIQTAKNCGTEIFT
jgi:hypothetical protein